MIEAVRTSQTSVYFYENIRRYIPENCHLNLLNYAPFLLALPYTVFSVHV